jgi:hypothetical protein
LLVIRRANAGSLDQERYPLRLLLHFDTHALRPMRTKIYLGSAGRCFALVALYARRRGSDNQW